MPWREPSVVDLREELVLKHLRDGIPVSELAARYAVSRKTAYKWIDRFHQHGRSGLADRSRAPRSCPHKISEELAKILLKARRAHPTWGPRKILPWLQRRQPDLELPAASTVGDLFRRHDLTKTRKRRRRASTRIEGRTQATEPNSVWTIDYKGHFRTSDHVYCYPLTIVDTYSRSLRDVRALDSTCYRYARRWIETRLREDGLPLVIRTDNGVPFAVPHARDGLSRLTVWWTRLGIRHERIDPGHPEQNGVHERMHRTLKAETARPPAKNHRAQQGRFDSFRMEYNSERPHEALDNRTPSELWTPSPRSYPEKLPLPQYPGHFEVRRILENGIFKFGGEKFFVGRALHAQFVGLEEIDNDLWQVSYFDLTLGRFHARNSLRARPAALQRRDSRYLLPTN